MISSALLAYVLLSNAPSEDPWAGRYEDYRYLTSIAIRLTPRGRVYRVTGIRGPDEANRKSVFTERVVGIFDPRTEKISGRLLFHPHGVSHFSGKWNRANETFDIVENQGDATLTYILRRRDSGG